jgi:zeta-carotene desaturase
VETDVLIVGGGFAGLAAALKLHRAGAKIQIVEKRPFFGGRAYSFNEPSTGQEVDNGQHLLMGAYRHTFEFLKDLGTYEQLEIQNGLEVSFAQGDGKISRLKCPQWPAPLHLAWGLLRFKGLKFGDKRGMARLIRHLKNLNGQAASLDKISVSQLMEQTQQTPQAVKMFWEPLGLATLNEPLNLASAALFAEVVQQGLLQKTQDSNLVIPKVGFSELYAKPAERLFEQEGVPMNFQTQGVALTRMGKQWTLQTRDGKNLIADSVLLALPPNALEKLLSISDPSLKHLTENLNAFQPSPIVSINLWFENFNPPENFMGLVDSPLHWFFNKTRILGSSRGNYVSLVVSGAYELSEKSKLQLVQMATEELQRFYPELKGRAPLHSQVIKENEATFSGRKGLMGLRPPVQSKVPGIFLAGDWVDTGLPATIESAVQSGHQAAAAILQRT